MNVLVIGSGAREHALAWKLAQSPHVDKLFAAPGNAGTAQLGTNWPDIAVTDAPGLVSRAREAQIGLTVVGPEAALAAGVADAMHAVHIPTFGPTRAGARLESSKSFAKQFMTRWGIATAAYKIVHDRKQAARALRDWPGGVVIKADGLAAGKGVAVADSADEALALIERWYGGRTLPGGGTTIVLEERLEGKEVSVMAVTNGSALYRLAPACDYKRAYDGDRGPNTGGMGAYSSDELLPEPLRKTIVSTIVEPTLNGLATDGIPYQGFLYIGLMLTRPGPQVLEFNCRLGDPETQAIVARMDFDLAEILEDIAKGRLQPSKLHWKSGASACVLLASGGYPGRFETGKKIEGLTGAELITGVKVLHAGTKRVGDEILTSGGRVLGVTAVGPTLGAALGSAYAAADRIHFEGMHYRRDIGRHASSLKASGN